MNYENLFEQLERHEGLRLCAYKCTKGYWTVGVGRNLETKGLTDSEQMDIFGQTLPKTMVIDTLRHKPLTEDQARVLFLSDVSEFEEACHQNIDMHLHNDARKAVFINMAFQMGITGLLKFKNTLIHAANQDYKSCADEMLDSNWAKVDTPARAVELAEQMRSGEWQ